MSKDKHIYGQGHGRIVPNQLLAKQISNQVFDRNLDVSIAPNIALANAEFEDQLLCGSTVTFLQRDTINEDLFQDTQSNEDPETDVIELCSREIEICGSKDFQIKLSVHQLRQLECEDLDNVYFETIEKTIGDTTEFIWDQATLATTLTMADALNMGNNAMGMGINLGSPDNPIEVPRAREPGAEAMEEVITNLQLTLSLRNAMTFDGDTALVLPTMAANKAQPIFRDLNQCCGDDNIRVNGQLSNTIYGFDTFQTNRAVLSAQHGGRTIYYVIAMDKHAVGFVSDFYNFKWWEGKRDWFLVGTMVHGAYVVYPEHIAVACITFV